MAVTHRMLTAHIKHSFMNVFEYYMNVFVYVRNNQINDRRIKLIILKRHIQLMIIKSN